MKAPRVNRIQRGHPFEIEIDGRLVKAYDGETIATVMLAEGLRNFYKDSVGHPPSRLYCGMGVCQQCLVTVNGVPNRQACQMAVRPGMVVKTNP